MTAIGPCRPSPLRPCRWALLLASALAMLLPACQAMAEASTVWELLPYRLQVLVAVAPDAAAGGVDREPLCASLATRAATVVGPRWVFTLRDAPPPLGEAMILDFDRITPQQLLEALPEADCDKVLLLLISGEADNWSLSARELDVRTQLMGTSIHEAVYHRARLFDAAFQSLLAAFSPLASVETVDVNRVTMVLRAADVPTRDPGLVLAVEGTIFRPVIRENDRNGKARVLQALDWSFLYAEKVAGTHVEARLTTGVRTALATRKRGRREQLAVVVRPPRGSTVLELRAADKSGRPLSGRLVYSHPVDSKETELLGTTDPHGKLRIEPAASGGVRVLLVKSGDVVIARLPLLPGLTPKAEARMTDDEPRLQVEGYINGFQEQFVDLIARRQVLMTRIRARIKAGKQKEAKDMLVELRRLPNQQDFAKTLQAARSRLSSDDPRTQKQINKLFDDTQTIVGRFLDPRPVDELERELAAGGPLPERDDDPPASAPAAAPAAAGAPASSPPTAPPVVPVVTAGPPPIAAP